MSGVHVISSISDIYKIIGEIEKLPLANEVRIELAECLRSIASTNIYQTSSSFVEGYSGFTDAVIILNKFATAAVDALEACALIPSPIGIICKAITTVVGFFFSKDVASVVIKRFTAILEADLIAKCRATCTKIIHCITYLHGLPAADKLTQEERNLHLQLIASDVPILTGLDEVLFLGEKIRDMVNIADLNRADKLFEHVQLYCCLATFRELFLLYRFSIQSTFFVESGSVRNVLEAQKANDKEILQFLYKPTTKTVCLFRCCFLDQWPILGYFLRRRGLFPDNLSDLNRKKCKIRSVQNSGRAMWCHKMPLVQRYRFDLLDGSDDAAKQLELRGGTDNVFTIWSHCFNPPRKLYIFLNRLIVSDSEPSPESSSWYLLKLQPESPGETPCYMIWLASNNKKCMYAKWDFFVEISSASKPGAQHFWKMELLHNA